MLATIDVSSGVARAKAPAARFGSRSQQPKRLIQGRIDPSGKLLRIAGNGLVRRHTATQERVPRGADYAADAYLGGRSIRKGNQSGRAKATRGLGSNDRANPVLLDGGCHQLARPGSRPVHQHHEGQQACQRPSRAADQTSSPVMVLLLTERLLPDEK